MGRCIRLPFVALINGPLDRGDDAIEAALAPRLDDDAGIGIDVSPSSLVHILRELPTEARSQSRCRWRGGRVRAMFHAYSAGNCVLLAAQCHQRGIVPTLIAGFRARVLQDAAELAARAAT